MKKNKKILVFVAHPDDEVLGCGGTIARLASEGNEVYIAILGEGITSRYKKREAANDELVKALHVCSKRVAKKLSAKDLFIYSLPDNRFDTLPLLDIIKIAEELISKIKPSVVYTHHAGDLNIDHVITNRAILTASRPVEGQHVKEIYTFEIPSSTEWAFGQFRTEFHPNVFVDISSMLKVKLQAIDLYKSEIRPYPHPRSSEALRAIAQRWGSVVGVQAAEAFELVREVR